MAGEVLRRERFQRLAPYLQRGVDQRPAMVVDEQVENDVQRGMLARKLLDATLRRMDAHQQLVERQRLSFGDDELAVEHAPSRRQCGQRGHDFGKVALERLSGLGSQRDIAPVLEGEAPKAVPLGLVVPHCALRKLGDEPRFHRGVVHGKRKRHRAAIT